MFSCVPWGNLRDENLAHTFRIWTALRPSFSGLSLDYACFCCKKRDILLNQPMIHHTVFPSAMPVKISNDLSANSAFLFRFIFVCWKVSCENWIIFNVINTNLKFTDANDKKVDVVASRAFQWISVRIHRIWMVSFYLRLLRINSNLAFVEHIYTINSVHLHETSCDEPKRMNRKILPHKYHMIAGFFADRLRL